MWVRGLWLRRRWAARDGGLELREGERWRLWMCSRALRWRRPPGASRPPGFGAVVAVAPAERVIGALENTDSGMRLLGRIGGVRGILAGLAEVTPEASGAEGGHAGGRA